MGTANFENENKRSTRMEYLHKHAAETIKSLQWIMFNFPAYPDADNDSDRICNAIHLCCEDAVTVIQRLQEMNKELWNIICSCGGEHEFARTVQDKAMLDQLMKILDFDDLEVPGID